MSGEEVLEHAPKKRGRKKKVVDFAEYDVKEMIDLCHDLENVVVRFSGMSGEEKKRNREWLGNRFLNLGNALLHDDKHDN